MNITVVAILIEYCVYNFSYKQLHLYIKFHKLPLIFLVNE